MTQSPVNQLTSGIHLLLLIQLRVASLFQGFQRETYNNSHSYYHLWEIQSAVNLTSQKWCGVMLLFLKVQSLLTTSSNPTLLRFLYHVTRLFLWRSSTPFSCLSSVLHVLWT